MNSYIHVTSINKHLGTKCKERESEKNTSQTGNSSYFRAKRLKKMEMERDQISTLFKFLT